MTFNLKEWLFSERSVFDSDREGQAKEKYLEKPCFQRYTSDLVLHWLVLGEKTILKPLSAFLECLSYVVDYQVATNRFFFLLLYLFVPDFTTLAMKN